MEWKKQSMWWTLLTEIFIIYIVGVSSRKLTTIVNPGCSDKCKNHSSSGFTNLVYVKSEDTDDSIHHIWSTIGNPSLLLLHMSPSASLQFQWAEEGNILFPEISYSGSLYYAYAVIFNKIWEYKDSDDTGTMSDDNVYLNGTDFGDLLWQNISYWVTVRNDQYTSATFLAMSNDSTGLLDDENGWLSFQVETQGDDGRSEKIPRLLYTSNSSQVRLILKNAVPHFDSSRFAIELSLFASENSSSSVDPFKLKVVKSMDDEYTPGVFKAMHLLSKGSEENNFRSYMTWKPVAYTSDELSVTGSTNTNFYTAARQQVALYNNYTSVASHFFKEHFPDIDGVSFNVSFGTTKDGFYSTSNYTQWSFCYGLGVPGEDSISSLVIIVISSGLGLPFLLIVLSCAYLVWHKRHMQKDDLLLSRR